MRRPDADLEEKREPRVTGEPKRKTAAVRRTLQRKNMMAANYRHIGGGENRLGRHYSRFSAFCPPQPLPVNHLLCENCRTQGRIGEVGLGSTLAVGCNAPSLD